MKVISLLQPWATLVVIGAKKIETRSWNTKYRGEILIHASKGFSNEQHDTCIFDPFYPTLLNLDYFDETKAACGLPTGAIIGKANIIHIVKSEYCFKGNEFEWNIIDRMYKYVITEQELAFGDYSENRFGWMLSDAVEFAQPIRCKGSLGLWNYEMPDHIHVANKYGGHATFDSAPDKKTLDAVNELADATYKKIKK